MNRFSSRYIDLRPYKTKEILLKVIQERKIILTPVNKVESMYRALCPFHAERTASFTVHNNTFFKTWGYKCFGCGRSGDVFRFLMLSERWEFWDSLVYVTKRIMPPNYRHIMFLSQTNQLAFEIPEEPRPEPPDGLPF